MIEIEKGKVKLSEQTVRELLSAIKEAKSVTKFTDEPLPEGDMSTDTFIKCKRERGQILVRSQYSGIRYAINLETRPQSQESLGYKLVLGKE